MLPVPLPAGFGFAVATFARCEPPRRAIVAAPRINGPPIFLIERIARYRCALPSECYRLAAVPGLLPGTARAFELGGLVPNAGRLFLCLQEAFGVIIYLITTNIAVAGYRFERSDGAAARNWASAEPIGARSARISLCLRGGTGV